MLKILIIDDDMLTRKGIQMLMPWEKHEMKIVGESSNGQEDLGFLEDHGPGPRGSRYAGHGRNDLYRKGLKALSRPQLCGPDGPHGI